MRTQLMWQLPTLLLTVIVAIGLMLGGSAVSPTAWTVVGLTLMSLVSVAAGVVPWADIAHRWHILMPLLSLLAVGLIGVQAVSVVPSVVLVGVGPVLWLVFEFGRVGTVSAVLSVTALLGVGYLGEASPPSSGAAWAQFVVVPLVALGLFLGAQLVADRLRRRGQTVQDQSTLLESTLELAHDRLLLVQAVLDSVGAAIVGYDHDGDVILENSSAHELAARVGVRLTDSWEGLWNHVYLEDRVTPVPASERVITRARCGEEVAPQTHWVGPPEDQVAVMLSARQIYRRNGDRLGAVVVGWDVTDIVEAVRVRDEFLKTVTHELRTPLTSIMGYQELIAEELDPQDQRVARMLEIAQRNAAVLLSRVSQLLQASGADGPGVHTQQVDVSTLLREAVAKHRSVASSAGITLATRVQPGVRAHLDPAAWEQVVDHLVSNAIKYTLGGGEIEVVLEQSGESFVLLIVDTGIGMSRAEQDRAFERFYRTTAARDRAIQGLGVGLSIAQEIIHAHGGQVSLSSAPGQGTSVAVELPLRPVAATA
ncbi:sensor histidine kinase [Nocardioides pacificus]